MPENQNLNNEQQETTPSGNKIYILSRNNYDNWQGSYGNNIFFVRENSADQDKMVSVYVGESKQSNIVVTDESDIWDRLTNSYTIPEKYQVSDKLFLIKRTLATETEQETPDNTIYGIVTWNGERFIDCGIPNNVIVLTDIEEGISDLSQWLSQNIIGIKDFIYIIPNYHSIYYYDGASGYISIISVDSFVTVEMLNEVASRIPVADELTVLSKVSNSQTIFSAAGADLSNKFVITGSSGSETSEQAGPGATIFNNYNPNTVSGKQGYKYGTTAIGAYSSAFGTGNVTRGANSVAFGSSNTIGISGPNSSVFGSSNTVSGSNSSAFGSSNTVSGTNSFAFGGSNTINGGYSNIIFGIGGNTIESSASGMTVFGVGNRTSSAIGFIAGSGNTTNAGEYISVFGEKNNLEISCSSSHTVGCYNSIQGTQDDMPYPSDPDRNTPYTVGYFRVANITLGTYNENNAQANYGHYATFTTDSTVINGKKFDFGGITIGYKNTLFPTATASISIGGYCDMGTPTASSFTYTDVYNTIKTPRSIVIGSGNTLNPSHKNSRDNFVIGTSNTLYATSSSYYAYSSKVHIFGDLNNIGDSLMANGVEGSTYVIGQQNTVGPNGVGSHGNVYVIGWNNQAGIEGRNLYGESMLIGHGLSVSSSNAGSTYIGKFNTGNNHDLVIANGVGDEDKFDAVAIDGSIIKVNPNRYNSGSPDFQGDLISGHGTSITLKTISISPTLSETGTYQLDRIPVNNSIAIVHWNNTNKLEFMLNEDNKFEFNIFANSPSGETISLDQTSDYSCLLVIPKLSSFNSASDIIENFTANDASKIYLLNPDIDISSYTTIHILLFYDLSNLCAIVSGYQEVTTP